MTDALSVHKVHNLRLARACSHGLDAVTGHFWKVSVVKAC